MIVSNAKSRTNHDYATPFRVGDCMFMVINPRVNNELDARVSSPLGLNNLFFPSYGIGRRLNSNEVERLSIERLSPELDHRWDGGVMVDPLGGSVNSILPHDKQRHLAKFERSVMLFLSDKGDLADCKLRFLAIRDRSAEWRPSMLNDPELNATACAALTLDLLLEAVEFTVKADGNYEARSQQLFGNVQQAFVSLYDRMKRDGFPELSPIQI